MINTVAGVKNVNEAVYLLYHALSPQNAIGGQSKS